MPANNLAKPSIIADIAGKKFAQRSFLLIASQLIRLAAQLSIIFIYARHLSYKDYGLYQSVWLYVNVISILSLFGLPSLILSTPQKNIFKWIKENGNHFFIIAVALNLLPRIFLLAVIHEFDITERFLIVVLIVIQNISIITETITIKKEKETLVLVANIIFTIGYFICHLFVLYTGYSLQLLLTGLIVVFIVKTIILFFFSKQQQEHPLDIHLIKTGTQWFYLGLVDLLGVLFKWLDKWLILFFLSVSQFAIYFNGAYEIPVFGLMLGAVGNIMLIELSKHRHDTFEQNKTLFINSSLLLASVVFPSFAFLLFYHHDFFTLIFSAKYTVSIPIFFISIFILPVRITNYTAALQVYHRNDLIVKGALLDIVVAILLMAILYPLLQMRGLALAFVLSTYVQAWYYLWQTSRLVKEKISVFFPIKELIIIMGISIVVMAITFFIFNRSTYPFGMIGGIVICSLLIALLVFFYLKKDGFIITGNNKKQLN
jgi:O-antigen/teichoic acid export membrane protein